MARQRRLDLPGIPRHIVQRGNNRLPCFLDDADRARYRHLLREALLANDCRLHAYVLMDNHVHLLVTPPAAGATSRMMQWLGRQYAAQFNARHGRTGTLWEGRYKACLVDDADYLLRCVRYIDLNPVRARMTDDTPPRSVIRLHGPVRVARRSPARPASRPARPRHGGLSRAARRGDQRR